PVANATISPAPPALQVRAGDPVTLRCSVHVGSAPVTFTWLRDGRQLARGPLLELGHVHVRHSGTYQCVATNQLGQDGHRVFRAPSPELALTVTTWGHRDTAVAAGVGGILLFHVLLLGVIGGCHWWLRVGGSPHCPRRTPPVPPEEGEVLYSQVVPTKAAGGECRAGDRGRGTRGWHWVAPVSPVGSPSATPEAPQVTYAELPGPRWHSGDSGDIYENVL
ncbi:FCRL4 protein, partial [Mohoua ochrocephala]|nr:FCRL4 protein [Mohoua ochrocephala]